MKLHLLLSLIVQLAVLHPLTIRAADIPPIKQYLEPAGIESVQLDALTQRINRKMPKEFKQYALLFGLDLAGSFSVYDPTQRSESERMKEVIKRSDQYLKVLKGGPPVTKDIYDAAASAARAFQ